MRGRMKKKREKKGIGKKQLESTSFIDFYNMDQKEKKEDEGKGRRRK